MKLIFAFCFTISFAGILKAQDTMYGNYSKFQLYADFDSLVRIVEQANPHLPIYKKMMGLDVIMKMKKNRTKIESIKSLSDYWYILNTTLNLIPEAHTRWLTLDDISGENYAYWKERNPLIFDSAHMVKIQHFTRTILDDQEKTAIDWDKEFAKSLSFDFMLDYVGGKYYNSKTLVYKKRNTKNNDSIILPRLAVLKKINNIDIDTFVQRNIAMHEYPYSHLRWDAMKNQYYCISPTIVPLYIKNFEPMVLEFYLPKENWNIKINFPDTTSKCRDRFIDECIIPRYKENENPYLPRIELFDSILYIRVPNMEINDLPIYEKKISELKKKDRKRINKVIIDIRRNGGGSDAVWRGIISLLTDKELCVHASLGIRNTQYFPDTAMFSIPFDSIPLYYDSLLGLDYRMVSIDSMGCISNIEPHKKSLKYKGKIYLLHDRESFSAANSLVTFAYTEDKIVSIGEFTGRLGGYGMTPSVYQLPITGMVFIMHTSIHIPSNTKEIADYFWNKTEVPVNTTPEHESYVGFWLSINIFNKDYLFKEDPFFKKAIEQP